MKIKLMMVVLFVFLFGCGVEKQKDSAKQACLDAGGIPIVSIWNGTSLRDCIFPPPQD